MYGTVGYLQYNIEVLTVLVLENLYDIAVPTQSQQCMPQSTTQTKQQYIWTVHNTPMAIYLNTSHTPHTANWTLQYHPDD